MLSGAKEPALRLSRHSFLSCTREPLMSTSLPPYRYDPKADKHAARLQARAQRDAYKTQRALYRQQTRHLRRGSMLGPVLLTGFGLVALLISTGRWSALTFAGWYARWWPALLVLAGAILLAEWAFDQSVAQRNPAATLPMRRRIGAGVVVLLVLLAALGGTFRTVHDQREFFTNGFSINNNNFAEFFGEKHDLPPQILDETIPAFTPGLLLTIENPHGDIHVTGKSNDGNLHITVNKQVYASDATSQAKGDQLTPLYVASPNGLSLTVPTVEGGSADLTLLVPESIALSLNASHGVISVTGFKASVSLTSNHGDVELQSVTGNVNALVEHSDSAFSAHNLTGNVTLKGNLGDVNLTDIAGQTYMEGDFYGDSHFERLLGPVTFQTSRTHLTLARLNGDIDLDHSNISGSQLVGPVSLRVKSRNISFDGIDGDLDLTNSNGSVDVTSSTPGTLTIGNTNGSINLTLPDHTGLAVSADTRGGTINDDFNLPVTDVGHHSTVTGTVGDGRNQIKLQTTHANIDLHKGPAPPIPH